MLLLCCDEGVVVEDHKGEDRGVHRVVASCLGAIGEVRPSMLIEKAEDGNGHAFLNVRLCGVGVRAGPWWLYEVLYTCCGVLRGVRVGERVGERVGGERAPLGRMLLGWRRQAYKAGRSSRRPSRRNSTPIREQVGSHAGVRGR